MTNSRPTAGSHLGPYEILAPLGAGGMGEVYRARDTQLGRDVALKILPASVADDPDRVARFKREAQLLAALNHPHIAAIYGLERAGTSQVLVMELVDGETLAERLKRGPLPVADASLSMSLRRILCSSAPRHCALRGPGRLSAMTPTARRASYALSRRLVFMRDLQGRRHLNWLTDPCRTSTVTV